MNLDSRSAEAHEKNQRRRSAVLSYPDLAKRLTLPPLEYDTPEQWSGFIPPGQWQGEPNDSPRRAALMEISADAWRREHELI